MPEHCGAVMVVLSGSRRRRWWGRRPCASPSRRFVFSCELRKPCPYKYPVRPICGPMREVSRVARESLGIRHANYAVELVPLNPEDRVVKMRKFFEEVTLLGQTYVRDDSKQIASLLPKGTTLKHFTRLQVGGV